MNKFISFIVTTAAIVNGYAQEIALGTWRTHNSYQSIHTIAIGNNQVYGASTTGIAVVNADNSLSTITRLDGLGSADITALAFDAPRSQLLVSYADGLLDIIKPNEIISFTTLKNSPTITGSKKINQVVVQDALAYLATDYGVVVFDLNQLEVKETWRDLGPAGQLWSINQCTFLNDSIFLATQQGVMVGSLTDNLLDFANWKRFDTGAFTNSVESIASFNNRIYAAIDGQGLFVYEDGVWLLQDFVGSDFHSLNAGNQLWITESDNLWKLNVSDERVQVTDSKIEQPVFATEDASGNAWIGDLRNGLVSDRTGSFESYIPNGPTFSGGFRLSKNSGHDIFAVSGGYTPTFSSAGNNEFVNAFSSGLWRSESTWLATDVTDVDFTSTKTIVSSFGSGLQVVENSNAVLYTNGNSPLSTNRIAATTVSKDGIWVTNYGAALSLHLLKNNNAWESFSFPFSAAQYPTDLLVDGLNQVWMILNPAQGGGLLVFDRESNEHAYLTEATGSGSLPSRQVYSLALDRNGFVWVGTAAGVAYLNPSQVLSGNVNSVKPVVNGRILLRDETTTAMAVDGGNRKWLGTRNGLWLFDAFGETPIHNFTTTNSPLPSDEILDIEIHPVTGEVFFATPRGIISYRSDATESSGTFSNVKIFPNPVLSTFTGQVSISGLATDARVKITDIAGKLIWETSANGGTAIWHVRDYNGRRAATGMYLIIAISQDGLDSVVGKIAVVN
ncbi:MAG: two-component regulator propeller domain-containing protein [Cyclobacteriaceae bacterium]|nr:MAG: two-component regulator propeller domain-containing protein [Cyclobacteriaceae bacterium]